MKNLVIIGAGGLAKEVVWVIRDINRNTPTYNILGYLDEESLIGQTINGINVIGSDGDLKSISSANDVWAVVAIREEQIRRRIVEQLDWFGRWATIIHPTAVVSESSQIGVGSIVFPFSTVGVDATIGKHCFVNIHTMVGHDCSVGDFSSVLAGSKLCGHVKIGSLSCISTNASILPDIEIGENVVIGAGSVVMKNVESNTSSFGVPSRVMMSRKPYKE